MNAIARELTAHHIYLPFRSWKIEWIEIERRLCEMEIFSMTTRHVMDWSGGPADLIWYPKIMLRLYCVLRGKKVCLLQIVKDLHNHNSAFPDYIILIHLLFFCLFRSGSCFSGTSGKVSHSFQWSTLTNFCMGHLQTNDENIELSVQEMFSFLPTVAHMKWFFPGHLQHSDGYMASAWRTICHKLSWRFHLSHALQVCGGEAIYSSSPPSKSPKHALHFGISTIICSHSKLGFPLPYWLECIAFHSFMNCQNVIVGFPVASGMACCWSLVLLQFWFLRGTWFLSPGG